MWLQSRNAFKYLEAVKRLPKLEQLTVPYFYSGISCKKKKMAPSQERRMIDRFKLWAKGGEGGSGCSSFRRSRRDRRGKPDGANGGRGGDVILECSTDVWDFSGLQHHINAKRGGNGAPKNMIGTRGIDKVVLVPVGTVIHLLEGELPSAVEKKVAYVDLDPWDIPGTLDSPSSQSSTDTNAVSDVLSSSSKQTFEKRAYPPPAIESPRFSPSKDRSQNELRANSYTELDYETTMSGSEYEDDSDELEQIQYNVAELTEPGEQAVVARGGEGGIGNIQCSKVFDDEEDRPPLNVGLPGTEAVLLLELKSIADVGLVGMPNAGKSTLLAALSRAKPAIGHYAFTTLRPNLGNLQYNDLSITVADIPGLIKGAHENRGLGHAFLRHIERTKVLAYVVDLAAGIDGRKGIPAWEQLKDLMIELEFYRDGLSGRPSLVVANKIDETGAEEAYEELKRRVQGVPIFPVCAVLEEGVPELKDGLKMLVNGEQSHTLKLDNFVLN